MFYQVKGWISKALDALRDPFEAAVCENVSICTRFRQPLPLLLLWKDLAVIGH